MIGKILGNYKILEEIGAGGMGVVYRVCHKEDPDIIRALKVIRPEFARDEGFVERFRRERKVLLQIRHPNIVEGHDFGTEGESHYLLTEYVSGESLEQRIKREKKLDVEEAARIAQEICFALEYAHTGGVVHRDLKPSNILLREGSGKAVLTDFGIVSIIGDSSFLEATTSTGKGATDEMRGKGAGASSPGTAAYMSPEQLSGGKVTVQSDIYQLGAVMYECLTGEQPMGRFPDPSALNPAVPKALDAVIVRCLEVELEERYCTAREVAEALRTAFTVPEFRKSAAHPKSLWPPAVLAVVLLCAGAYLIGTWTGSERVEESVAEEHPQAEPHVVEETRRTPAPQTVVHRTPQRFAPSRRTSPAKYAAARKAGVYEFPAGEFWMGSNAVVDERPRRRVHLSSYYLGQYEVTNADYGKCVAAGKCVLPNELECGKKQQSQSGKTEQRHSSITESNEPVTCVNWYEAKAYCTWAGMRLPTEAEWEKAASFSSGGVKDMRGNVWEWTADWYGDDYYKHAPDHDPKGPKGGSLRVVRGGSWPRENNKTSVSKRSAVAPSDRDSNRGMRCAANTVGRRSSGSAAAPRGRPDRAGQDRTPALITLISTGKLSFSVNDGAVTIGRKTYAVGDAVMGAKIDRIVGKTVVFEIKGRKYSVSDHTGDQHKAVEPGR